MELVKKFKTNLVKHLRRGQVYLLPTALGGYSFGLWLVLLLLSLGYGNNLILAFFLLFFFLNAWWLIDLHLDLKSLKGLKLSRRYFFANEPVFATSFQEGREKYYFSQNIDLARGDILQKRGRYEIEHIGVEREHALGLFRGLCFFKIKDSIFVGPSILKNEQLARPQKNSDPDRLGPYDPSLGAKRIAWKKFAKFGTLEQRKNLQKEQDQQEEKIELKANESEARLSEIMSLIWNKYQNGRGWIIGEKRYSGQDDLNLWIERLAQWPAQN